MESFALQKGAVNRQKGVEHQISMRFAEMEKILSNEVQLSALQNLVREARGVRDDARSILPEEKGVSEALESQTELLEELHASLQEKTLDVEALESAVWGRGSFGTQGRFSSSMDL